MELTNVVTVVLCNTVDGPLYVCPSSPGLKLRVEQKPSEEDIRSVKPSDDLLSKFRVSIQNTLITWET